MSNKFIGYGNILAAEFVQGEEVHQAFAHVGEKELVSYFDQDGNSMRKQLLKAPVKYANVTTGYIMSILGILPEGRFVMRE